VLGALPNIREMHLGKRTGRTLYRLYVRAADEVVVSAGLVETLRTAAQARRDAARREWGV
jgi:hypothetical protein